MPTVPPPEHADDGEPEPDRDHPPPARQPVQETGAIVQTGPAEEKGEEDGEADRGGDLGAVQPRPQGIGFRHGSSSEEVWRRAGVAAGTRGPRTLTRCWLWADTPSASSGQGRCL